jgi:hypothetical protein
MRTPEQIKADLKRVETQLKLIEVNKQLAGIKPKSEAPVFLGEEVGDITPTQSEAKRYAALAARNAAAGVADVADLPALPFEAARYGSKYVANKIAPRHVDAPEFGKWLPELGEKVGHKIDEMTGGYTVPKDAGERFFAATTRGVASLPGGSVAGKLIKQVPKLEKAGKFIQEINKPTAANIGAAAGASGLQQRYLETASDPTAMGAFLTGLGGGVLGAKYAPKLVKGTGHVGRALTRNPKNTLADIVGTASGWSPLKYGKAMELGLQPSLGTGATKPNVISAEALAAKYPSTSDKYQAILDQREGTLAGHLGVKGDLVDEVKYIDHSQPKLGAELYKKAKSDIYNAYIEPYAPLQKELRDKGYATDATPTLSKIKEEFKTGVHKESEKADFQKTIPGKAEKAIFDSIAENTQFSAEDIKKASKTIDGARTELSRFGLDPETINQKLLELFPNEMAVLNSSPTPLVSLQKLITQRDKALDIVDSTIGNTTKKRQAAKLHSILRDAVTEAVEPHATPEMLASRAKANQEWAHYASKRQSNMKKYVEELRDQDSDLKAFDLVKTDHKYLKAASDYLDPQDQLTLRTSLIKDLGKNDSTGRFNIAQAQTNFRSKPPEWQQAYLDGLPKETRKNFENTLEFIADNKLQMSKMANTSHTSVTSAGIKYVVNIARAIGSGALAAVGLVDPMTALKPIAGLVVAATATKAGANLLTDPLVLRRINDVMQAKNARVLSNRLDTYLKTPTIKQALGRSALSLAPHQAENKEG